MTYESTIAAAARLPRAPLWGIGRYRVAGEPVDLPLGWDDLGRDAAWARSLLGDLGLGRGDVALVVAGGDEAVWVHPLQDALASLGVACAMAWAHRGDAPRIAMLLRRVAPALVLGLDGAVVERLVERSGGPEEVRRLLAGVPHLYARHDAHGRIADLGLEPRHHDHVGPMVAMECTHRRGAHVDPQEWAVEVVDDRLRVTTVGPRAHRLDRADLGISARLTDPADVCPCGRPGPRLLGVGPVPSAAGVAGAADAAEGNR